MKASSVGSVSPAIHEFRNAHHVAGVSIVLLEHRGACSHMLRADVLMNAFLKPERCVGML